MRLSSKASTFSKSYGSIRVYIMDVVVWVNGGEELQEENLTVSRVLH